MDSLTEIVKLEFITLYANYKFLNKFHLRNLQSIRDYGYKVERDSIIGQDYIIYRTRSKLYFPNVPKLGNLNTCSIKNSKYKIT